VNAYFAELLNGLRTRYPLPYAKPATTTWSAGIARPADLITGRTSSS